MDKWFDVYIYKEIRYITILYLIKSRYIVLRYIYDNSIVKKCIQ